MTKSYTVVLDSQDNKLHNDTQITWHKIQHYAVLAQAFSLKISTIDIPYLALTGKVWDVFCEYRLLINLMHESLWFGMKYHVAMDRIITATDCIMYDLHVSKFYIISLALFNIWIVIAPKNVWSKHQSNETEYKS